MTDAEWNSLPNTNDKWITVVIEGERVKDKDLIFEIIMRMDIAFNPCSCLGNNKNYNAAIRDMLDIPTKMDNIILEHNGNIKLVNPYINSKDKISDLAEFLECDAEKAAKLLNKYRGLCTEDYIARCDTWMKRWKGNPHRYFDNTCLLVDLVSSSYICGPRSFIHPRTGKIELVHNTGRGCYSCSCNKEELEWFAREFPQVELTVTYYDSEYRDGEFYSQNPICTLQLKNGEVTHIATKPRNNRLLKKYDRGVHLFGSSNYSWINILSDKLKLWKIKSFLTKHGFYKHNSRINADYKFENYYSLDELKTMIESWRYDNN